MDYLPNHVRQIYMYKVEAREKIEILRFTRANAIVSHVKLARNPGGGLIVVYVEGGR